MWTLTVQGDSTLTAAQAAALKAAVVAASAGLGITRSSFTCDHLPGVSGALTPPLAADIAVQAGQHVAIRN